MRASGGHVGRLSVNLAPVLRSFVEIRIGIEAVDNRTIMNQRGDSMSSVKGICFLCSVQVLEGSYYMDTGDLAGTL